MEGMQRESRVGTEWEFRRFSSLDMLVCFDGVARVRVLGARVGVLGARVGVLGARVGVLGARVGVLGARVGVLGASTAT